MTSDIPLGMRINGDTAYLLLCTAMVLFMLLPGLALFYGGLVQSKHVMSVMMQCFGIACVCGLSWLVCGYSLAFSGNGSFVGDLSYSMMGPIRNDHHEMVSNVPIECFFLFQGTFAVITPALVIGAWAERARFGAVLVFSLLWQILVYCPVCHWVWGGGWLGLMGVRDFAGGLVVHATCGAAAIVAAKMLPPRPGFPHKLAPPHSLPMVFTGASMLWVGWFGFNGGSALHASTLAAMATITTFVSACCGIGVWLAIQGFRTKPTVEAAVTGMVAGLGSITPASGFVGVPGAVIIGTVAGLGCYVMTALIKERGLADDSLDVFSVHGVGGIIGTILTAPLSAKSLGGVGFDEAVPMVSLLGVQTLGVLATVAYTAVVTAILIVIINRTMGFCHSVKDQMVGLDIVVHGAHAYEMHEVKVKDKATASSEESDSVSMDDDESDVA